MNILHKCKTKKKTFVCVFVQKERSSLLKELKALREERTQLQTELEKYRECDPEVIEEMSEYTCRLKSHFLSFRIDPVTES